MGTEYTFELIALRYKASDPVWGYVVAERKNGDTQSYKVFETREWADSYKRLCERLEQIRIDHALGDASGRWRTCHKSLGELHASMFGSAGGGEVLVDNAGNELRVAKIATKDDLAFGALLARWTEPLRFKLRRAYWFLMWGERGKVVR